MALRGACVCVYVYVHVCVRVEVCVCVRVYVSASVCVLSCCFGCLHLPHALSEEAEALTHL